jgi:hypothetical protein
MAECPLEAEYTSVGMALIKVAFDRDDVDCRRIVIEFLPSRERRAGVAPDPSVAVALIELPPAATICTVAGLLSSSPQPPPTSPDVIDYSSSFN